MSAKAKKSIMRGVTCSVCGFAGGHDRGDLVFVPEAGSWYHKSGCAQTAHEEYTMQREPKAPKTPKTPKEPMSTLQGWAEVIALQGGPPAKVKIQVEQDGDGAFRVASVETEAGSNATVKPLLGAAFVEEGRVVVSTGSDTPPIYTTSEQVVGACWEPGNGTRYDLLIINMARKRLLVWSNGGRRGGGVSMFLPDVDVTDLDLSYLSEKLGCGEADAEAIMAFLRLVENANANNP